MRKEDLRKLRALNATKAMMARAREDRPKIIKKPWGGKETSYKYGIYVRVQILNGILKAAIFLVDRMRLGCSGPVYEVFINKDTGEFITWDVVAEKWRTSKLDMLEWPEYFYRSGKYSNPETNKSIKRYLGVSRSGYAGILEYQLNVRKHELKQKHKRETNPWDMDMELIPELPKDWNHWVDKTAIEENFIFYEYSRKGATQGYCTWCEKQVPISKPKHNLKGRCKCCGRPITFKSKGKAGCFITNRYTAYLLQKIENGFVCREFKVHRHYYKGRYEMPERHYFEQRRVLYATNGERKTYYYGDYKNTGLRWIKTSNMEDQYWSYYYAEYKGRVYMRTIPSLAKKELSRTGLPEMLKTGKLIDPESYLVLVARKPYLEQIAKAGLTQLAYDIYSRHEDTPRVTPCGNLAKSIGIDRQRMKRLKENNGGVCFLEWMKHEKRIDTILDNEDIKFFDSYNIKPKDLDFIINRMTYKGVCNYLKKQYRASARTPKELIGTWEDYLCMANRLKMNTMLEIFYKPKDLIKSHDEAVKLSGGEDIARRAGEVAEKYPDVDDICKSIKTKYEFSDKDYSIVVPERIEDIIMEGRVLGHCLDGSDRYFDRIQRKESFIVFLRKTEEIDTPYYTMEIEPGGATRQKRTTGDKQNKDFEDAVKFIKKWQKEIQKNLSEEDHLLADESERLRIEEFVELRKSKAKIWRGPLAGQLLVDVLEADLMEVAG